MGRNIKDANFIATKALPAAGASVSTTAFDITGSGFVPEEIEAQLSLPATPNLADAKTITLTIEDSADNSSFAAVAALATLVVTGAGGAGAAAASRLLKFPSNLRRYVRVTASVDASGGDNTAVSVTFQILF